MKYKNTVDGNLSISHLRILHSMLHFNSIKISLATTMKEYKTDYTLTQTTENILYISSMILIKNSLPK